jgi:type II secretory pathway pseudopilin PulG
MQPGGPVDQARPMRKPRRARGAVLLEVLLALALFVFAAAVVSSGLNAAVERTLRLKAQTHALDLAVSVLSEVQMGIRPAETAGPEPFEAPFEPWTWEIEAVLHSFGTDDTAGLQQVTVIVRGGTPATVQRLTEILVVPPGPSVPAAGFVKTGVARRGEVAAR